MSRSTGPTSREGFALHRAGPAQDPDGRPLLVLVHGLGSAAGGWDPVVPHLVADHRLVLVDLPGHGVAPPAADPAAMGPAALGRRLRRLAVRLAEESGGPVHLVGHSLGGWVVLEAAADDDPDRPAVTAVTAFAPAGLWRSPRRRPRLLPTGQQFARLARRLPVDLVPTRIGRTLAFAATSAAPRRLDPDLAREAVAAVAGAAGYAAADAALAAGSFTRAADVRVPVTVVVGLRDRVLPPTHLRRDLAPPGTRWLEWADCGHVPPWDRPQDCADLLRGVPVDPSRGPARRTTARRAPPAGRP